MTDLYIYELPNAIKARAEKLKIDEVWMLEPTSGEYQKLVHPGGGEDPIELPYYLKPAHIAMEGETTNTRVDVDSFDVNKPGTSAGTSLQSDALIFGDSAGNSSLTKTGVDVVNNLKNITSIAEPAASSNKLVLVDPSTGVFGNSNSYTLDGNGYSMITRPSSITTYYPAVKRYSKMGPTEFIIGSTTDGYTVDNSQSYTQATPGYLRMRKDGVTKSLTFDDIAVTNQLKALTNISLTHDHKGIVYNTVTKAFNTFDITYQWMTCNDLRNASYIETPTSGTKLLTRHATTGEYNYIDIPTGIVVPSYIKSSSIEMLAPDAASEAYIAAVNGNQTQITVRNKTPNTNYCSMNASGIDIKPVIGATASLNWDGVTYLNKRRNNWHQKKLTGPYNFPMINDALNGIVTGNGATGVQTFNMANQDEIYIYTNGGDYIRYKRWYAIRIGDSTPLPNSLVELSIVEHYDGNYDSNNIASIHMTRLPTAITTPFTVQAGCVLFKIGNPNASITTSTNFNGVIKIKMLNRDTTTMNNV